eukprot:GHRR01022627.1.p2 GENE.GHRR01022627.1~~GHRR01022627.1.p2  ORF type:complete len:101 (+),score=10.14 GHRR01022627.1:269-571(+)
MGGGTAAMLTMMLRDKVSELSTATAWAIACPACMTLQLAGSCAPFVTTLIHGTDIVPTFSSGAVDNLRQEVGTHRKRQQLNCRCRLLAREQATVERVGWW